MKLYDQVIPGTFIARPNRFIAQVRTSLGEVTCHVKNTGRCRELLVPGVRVTLSVSDNPMRKTKYDLVSVYKGERFINMDSQAPNKAAQEAFPKLFPGLTLIKPEAVFGDSRLDFYLEQGEKKSYVEVKGVTLEENGHALFPDAPTQRGIKHLKELERCAAMGCGAYILFIIQMKPIAYFSPNWKTHPAFGEALKHATEHGVKILAYDCQVTDQEMTLDEKVEFRLCSDS